MTNGKSSYDTLDDYQPQFEMEQNGTAKLKPIKKPVDKFLIKETIYELDDDDINDDIDVLEEVETKRYKCSSPRRQHRSVRSPELDFEFDDEELRPSSEERTTTPPLDMSDSHRHSRTYSNSSDNDE